MFQKNKFLKDKQRNNIKLPSKFREEFDRKYHCTKYLKCKHMPARVAAKATWLESGRDSMSRTRGGRLA